MAGFRTLTAWLLSVLLALRVAALPISNPPSSVLIINTFSSPDNATYEFAAEGKGWLPLNDTRGSFWSNDTALVKNITVIAYAYQQDATDKTKLTYMGALSDRIKDNKLSLVGAPAVGLATGAILKAISVMGRPGYLPMPPGPYMTGIGSSWGTFSSLYSESALSSPLLTPIEWPPVASPPPGMPKPPIEIPVPQDYFPQTHPGSPAPSTEQVPPKPEALPPIPEEPKPPAKPEDQPKPPQVEEGKPSPKPEEPVKPNEPPKGEEPKLAPKPEEPPKSPSEPPKVEEPKPAPKLEEPPKSPSEPPKLAEPKPPVKPEEPKPPAELAKDVKPPTDPLKIESPRPPPVEQPPPIEQPVHPPLQPPAAANPPPVEPAKPPTANEMSKVAENLHNEVTHAGSDSSASVNKAVEESEAISKAIDQQAETAVKHGAPAEQIQELRKASEQFKEIPKAADANPRIIDTPARPITGGPGAPPVTDPVTGRPVTGEITRPPGELGGRPPPAEARLPPGEAAPRTGPHKWNVDTGHHLNRPVDPVQKAGTRFYDQVEANLHWNEHHMMHEIGPDAVQDAAKQGRPVSDFTGIERAYNPLAPDSAGANVGSRMGLDGAEEFGEELATAAGESWAQLGTKASTAFETDGALGVTRVMESTSPLFESMIAGARALGASAEAIGVRIATWLVHLVPIKK